MVGEDSLYVGISGHVVRVRKRDGEEIWRTKLKGGSYVNVVLEPDGVFAYTQGVLYALDPLSGEVRWQNGLPKLGYSHAIIGSANQAPLTVAIAAQAAAQAANRGAAPHQ